MHCMDWSQGGTRRSAKSKAFGGKPLMYGFKSHGGQKKKGDRNYSCRRGGDRGENARGHSRWGGILAAVKAGTNAARENEIDLGWEARKGKLRSRAHEKRTSSSRRDSKLTFLAGRDRVCGNEATCASWEERGRAEWLFEFLWLHGGGKEKGGKGREKLTLGGYHWLQLSGSGRGPPIQGLNRGKRRQGNMRMGREKLHANTRPCWRTLQRSVGDGTGEGRVQAAQKKIKKRLRKEGHKHRPTNYLYNTGGKCMEGKNRTRKNEELGGEGRWKKLKKAYQPAVGVKKAPLPHMAIEGTGGQRSRVSSDNIKKGLSSAR